MSQLTPQQQQVVAHTHGHARVVAVAGAGKTTTLTHFIGARLSQGVRPKRMLVLMYNVSARKDFEAKLRQLLPHQTLPEVRTFHSLGLRIYQSLIYKGHLPQYQGKPLSDGELEPIIWRLLLELAEADVRQEILSQKKKWVEPALSFIDLVKADVLAPEVVFEQLELPPKCKLFIPLFYRFEQWRKEQKRISYADMLYEPVQVFLHNPQVAKEFGGHLQWILVDEYQDINAIQQCLLEFLYAGHGQLMVIGDPDQTIYEFRGSKPEFIVKKFDQTMQQVTLHTLPHTFRYGHALSLLANHLISHNHEREKILCLSHPSTPQTSVQYHATSNESQAILALVKAQAEQRPYTDIAIINRIWALCAPLELAFLQAGIPYQMYSNISVLERTELKVFWYLYELAAGVFQAREEGSRRSAWLHFLTTPYPKIKHDILVQLAAKLTQVQAGFGEALAAWVEAESSLSRWQAEKLLTKAAILADAEYVRADAYRLLIHFIEGTELLEDIVDNSFSAQQADDQVQTIKAFARFIQETKLSSQTAYQFLTELKGRNKAQQHNHGVHLISVHKSKGLEWPVVIIPGLNSHYYPYTPEVEFSLPASLESERRLLYVAMTRAKQQLHLFIPQMTSMTEHLSPRERPSRFEAELNLPASHKVAAALYQQQPQLELAPQRIAPWLEQYIQALDLQLSIVASQPAVAAKPERPSLIKKLFKRPSKVQRIEHHSLGMGTLIEEDDKHLKVQFDGEGKIRVLDKRVAQAFITRL